MNTTLKEETLGQRLKVARVRKRMTQEQLADIMRVPKTTLSAYENDKVDIKGSVIVELSRHLGTTPNYLLGYENKENPFLSEAETLLSRIQDKNTQEMLLIQIRALAAM